MLCLALVSLIFPVLCCRLALYFVQVEGGHRAILYSRLGGISNVVKGEGTHFKIPWLHRPYVYNVRSTPRSIKSLTGSRGIFRDGLLRLLVPCFVVDKRRLTRSLSDLQMVDINLRVIYRPMVEKLPDMYRTLGLDYDER